MALSAGASVAARLGEGARMITDESGRRLYARDLADLPPLLERALFRTTPRWVVQPRHADDIARVVRLANEEGIPVFPRGVASSAYGGPVPTTDGIVVDLSPMQKIDEPNGGAKTITVDAGARWGDVEDELARHDLQLFTYPSNRLATVAGWIAGGGFGLNGLKYGHISRYVTALELITPQGEMKTVRRGDADLAKYFGTEGQMGIIARVTLRVREKSKIALPHLLCFESDQDALAFFQEMLSPDRRPASVEFFDASLMQLLNEHQLFQDKPALLIFIDEAETERQFSQALSQPRQPLATQLPDYVARSLWADRFFPMRIRSRGPSLLAAEMLLPPEQVANFLSHARRLARRFGLEMATECHILSTDSGIRVLAMPIFLTDINQASYSLHLAFVSLLDRIGEKYGGQPYNLGIWHAPFFAQRFDAVAARDLRAFKLAQDPRNILNPHKFFRVESRFFGLPGSIFHPHFFPLAMDALARFSIVLSPFTRQSSRPSAKHFEDVSRPQSQTGTPAGYDLHALARTATACASCGACIPVCPAYVHTKDERVTGRAKMWLTRRVIRGSVIFKDEADAAWQCVRCRACAEVCQVQLPLMAAYEKLEEELGKRFGRPDALIEEFIAGMERNPEYRAHVGLSLPIELTEQRWRTLIRNPSPAIGQPPIVSSQATNAPDHSTTHASRYHIATLPALPRLPLLGKFAIDRSDQCIGCGHCAEACVYGVHFRSPQDFRRMGAPKDELCRACFRCVQECPRGALTLSFNGEYAHTGRGIYTSDFISSLARQADEGKLPVSGAGYRGPFAGPGFDSMWTDMSEIVRPTRDGIHGREYISTIVDLGRRAPQLQLVKGSPILPPYLEIPLPILFGELPIHRSPAVLLSIAQAAQRLGTFALISRTDWFDALAPFAHHIALAVTPHDLDEFIARFGLIEISHAELLPRVKALAPHAIISIRLDGNTADLDFISDIARAGGEIVHLAFDPLDPEPLLTGLPRVHRHLVDQGLRDAITLIASGAIAMAEHVPKTVLLGADAVAVDLPLIVALECLLEEQCFSGRACPREVESIDPAWGEQRIVNLVAAWRNQLLEVLGAMGIREVRRMRGERERAMFKSELDAKLFAPIFGAQDIKRQA